MRPRNMAGTRSTQRRKTQMPGMPKGHSPRLWERGLKSSQVDFRLRRTLYSPASSPLQHGRRFIGGDRLTEVVSLNPIASAIPKEIHLRFVFHAFCYHLEMQGPCHADDCGGDGRVPAIRDDIPQKRLIDL